MQKIVGVFGLIWKLYIAVVFFIFALLFYPFFWVLQLRPSWRKYGFQIFILWSWLLRIFCIYPVRVKLKSPLPKAPFIIVSNHTSYLDIFLLPSILPKHPFAFLGKAEILKYPIVRTYFKALNIPVYRKDKSKAGQALGQAKKAMEGGWSIVIFPEGTIPEENIPQMYPFKNGAFRLAKNLNVPILPLTFTQNFHLFSDPTHILGPAHPGVVEVHIHPYISVEEIAACSSEEISDKCFELIEAPLKAAHPHLFKKS
jgi:1-acyl-sn-glycerol-3-phosphate acyltransferase